MSAASIASKACQGLNCEKPAQLQCPTCLKLKVDGSYFCSQSCFKRNWAVHKGLHQTAQLSDRGTYNPFPQYHFTGSIRPEYPLGPRRPVPAHIPRPDYAETGIPASEHAVRSSTKIECLGPEEIAKIRHVAKMGREVLDAGARAIRVGVTTDEIDAVIHQACIERNAYPSPLNYYEFPKSMCSSVNEVICHGIPDKRPLEDGDILNLDISIYLDGFHADMNKTYFVGNVDKRGRELVDTTRECLDKAIAMVEPGALYRDLGNVIEKHARSKGFSVVRTYCGHGIHRLFHCTPNVPHYAKNKAIGVMKPGHVFTIEPMINEGSHYDETWPDNWTSTTRDGKRSAQFEHMLLVTETGCEVLSRRLETSP
ncbi:Methionine aminopeptidase 1 [Dimargaris xerosporica]|nr:Methionine aminopeptidase 1 [Dimargaris xerosporica]